MTVFGVPAETADALVAYGRRRGATPYMTLLAAFCLLLGRYGGRSDVAVGSPVAGRPGPELDGVVGFFVNMLVMRLNLAGDPAFGDLVDRARQTALDAFAHQDVPFERLAAALHPDRDLTRNPLFQHVFAYEEDPETGPAPETGTPDATAPAAGAPAPRSRGRRPPARRPRSCRWSRSPPSSISSSPCGGGATGRSSAPWSTPPTCSTPPPSRRWRRASCAC
nr:hypothetical protein GCM10020093_034100 [Planobispora longispora]